MPKIIKSKEDFKKRVYYYAKKIGIEVKSLVLRPMENKWASCSTNGSMNFNIELLSVSQQLCDYVIVHELLHFKAPNHGRLWKSMMRVYLGDYEKFEKQLKLLASH